MASLRSLSPGVIIAFLCGLLASATPSQKPAAGTTKDDDDIVKIGVVDPYTGGAPEVMAAAGIVAYGPFPWADAFSTTDVDRVLGEGRVLWMETAHFRIGLSLKTEGWPEESDQRKALQEELKQLHKLVPKLPERPKKLDPWIRLHLYAQRVEGAYADFLKLIGATDADFPARGPSPGEGAYLGLPGKFLVLLFQKKSDMGRYMERFCGRQSDSSMRYYHDKSHQMLACISAEGMEGFNEAGLHGHVLYAVYHNLLHGYQGYRYSLPLWFDEGLAHWYSRKVPSSMMNVEIRDDEAVAEEKQNNWPVKVRRRAQHVGAFFPFETMIAWEKWDEMGYHAHAQSWSRVDYLMQLDAEKVGLMIRRLKSLPDGPGYEVLGAQARTLAQKLLIELFELDAQTFDEKWREWVLKTYPKK
ncbi:MAG: hypothetical protein ABIP94_07960 [Planctomycetota bacterium]